MRATINSLSIILTTGCMATVSMMAKGPSTASEMFLTFTTQPYSCLSFVMHLCSHIDSG